MFHYASTNAYCDSYRGPPATLGFTMLPPTLTVTLTEDRLLPYCSTTPSPMLSATLNENSLPLCAPLRLHPRLLWLLRRTARLLLLHSASTHAYCDSYRELPATLWSPPPPPMLTLTPKENCLPPPAPFGLLLPHVLTEDHLSLRSAHAYSAFYRETLPPCAPLRLHICLLWLCHLVLHSHSHLLWLLRRTACHLLLHFAYSFPMFLPRTACHLLFHSSSSPAFTSWVHRWASCPEGPCGHTSHNEATSKASQQLTFTAKCAEKVVLHYF